MLELEKNRVSELSVYFCRRVLASGPNVISVAAKDVSGNVSESATLTVVYNPPPPGPITEMEIEPESEIETESEPGPKPEIEPETESGS